MVPMRERADSLPMNATGYPVHALDPPSPVLVWITKPGRGPLQVQALATGWTARAGRIEYTDEHGRSETIWVWANAIERQEPHRPPTG